VGRRRKKVVFGLNVEYDFYREANAGRNEDDEPSFHDWCLLMSAWYVGASFQGRGKGFMAFCMVNSFDGGGMLNDFFDVKEYVVDGADGKHDIA